MLPNSRCHVVIIVFEKPAGIVQADAVLELNRHLFGHAGINMRKKLHDFAPDRVNYCLQLVMRQVPESTFVALTKILYLMQSSVNTSILKPKAEPDVQGIKEVIFDSVPCRMNRPFSGRFSFGGESLSSTP